MNKKYHALAEKLDRMFGENFFTTNSWNTKQFYGDNDIDVC